MPDGASTVVDFHVKIIVPMKSVSGDGEFITSPSHVDSLLLKLLRLEFTVPWGGN